MGLSEPTQSDEGSNRIPPTSQEGKRAPQDIADAYFKLKYTARERARILRTCISTLK